MPKREMNGLLRHLRRTAFRHDGGGLTDGQLLDGFLRARQAAAFEELVRRHGPMVLGVCRRVLVNLHDAEDAFQATFLILVRKASSIVARETVGNWLYGVAYRTAQKARAAAALRRAKERQMAKPEAIEEDVWRDLRPLLDQELSRLPDKYREPVVLCDLEGHTRKAAARRLGCPEGTLSVRLSRARVMLAKRLARHGLALSGGAVAAALSHNTASACVPAPLLSSTVQAATLVAAGHAAAGAVSAPVAALMEGVLETMFRTKVKVIAAVALTLGMIGVGFGIYQAGAAPPGTTTLPAVAEPAAPVPGDTKPADEANNAEKINLPTGAPLTQVLVSLDKDGKLVVKHAVTIIRGVPLPLPGPGAPGGVAPPLPGAGGAPGRIAPAPAGPGARGGAGSAPIGGGTVAPPTASAPAAPPTRGDNAPLPPGTPGDGPAPAAPPPPGGGFPGGAGGGFQGKGGFPGGAGGGILANIKQVTNVQTQTYDLDDVQVMDNKGKKVDTKELAKLLKEETVAMASFYGQPVDPLHLRVLKDGILTFVLPQPKAGVAPALPGVAPPGLPGNGALPPPANVLPPNPGGFPGGATGGAPPRFGPANTLPTPGQTKPPAPPGASGGTSEGA
jgi:RNA polymerase sigma factor (sigma-70 family)